MIVGIVKETFNTALSLFLARAEIDAIPESSSDEWEYVLIGKRDEDNRPKTRIVNHRVIDSCYSDLLNRRSGELYLSDPNWTQGVKFYALLFGVPLSCVLTMGTNALSIIFHLGHFFSDKIEGPELKSKVTDNIRNIYVSPWFSTGMWIAALYGLTCDQWKAKVIFSKLERAWRGMDPTPVHFNQFKTFSEFFTSDWTAYLAYCFQPKGNIEDRRRAGHLTWQIKRRGHDPLIVYNTKYWDLNCAAIFRIKDEIIQEIEEHLATRGSR